MAKLIGLRAYARSRHERGLIGGTLGAVQKAIASGRITPIDGKIDPEVADIQWAAKTDADQQARGARGGHAPQEPAPAEPPKSTAAAPGDRDGYFATKARRELAEAKLAELKLLETSGQLVRDVDVRKVIFEKARVLRDRILTVPDRLAPVLAAETNPARCHDLLMAELKTTLADLAGGGAAAPS